MFKHLYRLAVTVILFTALVLDSGCKQNAKDTSREIEKYNVYIKGQLDLMNSGKIAGPKAFIDSISSYCDQLHEKPTCLFRKYLEICMYYFHKGNYDSSLVYVDKSLRVFEQNNLDKIFPVGLINILSAKGESLCATNRFDEAYYYYFKAKQLAEEIKDTCELSPFYYSLAIVSYKQKKYYEALTFFKLTYKFSQCKQQSITYQTQEYLDDIALCYEKLNMPDSALYYYQAALSFTEKNMESFDKIAASKAVGVILGNMGGLYLSKGDVDTAVEILKKSYAINIQPYHEKQDAVLTHLKLANAYYKKYAMAILFPTLTDIRKELDTISHPLEAEYQWRQLMYLYYKDIGKQKEAFTYYYKYTTLRDSLWENDKIQLQNDLSKELKDKEHLYQIASLQNKRKFDRLYLFIVMAILCIACLIGRFVYLNYKKNKKHLGELKALNNQVLNQKMELEKKNIEKDRILDVVAHDLRSPVSGIFSLADIMVAEDYSGTQAKQSAGIIKNASLSALSLINELLGYRNDVTKTYIREQVDLLKLVDESIELLKFKAGEKGIILHKHFPPSPVFIHADKEKIERVLQNLLGNAIKFSRLKSDIDIIIEKSNSSVLIKIRDNGIGIPQKQQAEVFDMFTQVKRKGTAGEQSYGLGLSICKQIVEAHKGKIWFESEEGKGSCFYVALPVSDVL